MSKHEKAKERLRNMPKDFTFSEAKNILLSLGFEESNKGRTSGSRVRFYREKDRLLLDMHKPHPNDEMKGYAIKQLVAFLIENGEL